MKNILGIGLLTIALSSCGSEPQGTSSVNQGQSGSAPSKTIEQIGNSTVTTERNLNEAIPGDSDVRVIITERQTTVTENPVESELNPQGLYQYLTYVEKTEPWKGPESAAGEIRNGGKVRAKMKQIMTGSVTGTATGALDFGKLNAEIGYSKTVGTSTEIETDYLNPGQSVKVFSYGIGVKKYGYQRIVQAGMTKESCKTGKGYCGPLQAWSATIPQGVGFVLR